MRLNPPLPFRSEIGPNYVVIKLSLEIQWKFSSYHHQFSSTCTQRNYPSVFTVCFPVGCDNGSGVHIPAVTKLFNDKQVEEHMVYVGPFIISCKRPCIVYQHTKCPILRLYQRHQRWACTFPVPLSIPPVGISSTGPIPQVNGWLAGA